MDIDTVKYIEKKLKEKKELLESKVIFGVDTWDQYQYIIGQIRSINDLLQDLRDLLKKQEL